MNVRPGDIIFVMHEGDALSRTISWFMNSRMIPMRFSHSGIIEGVYNGKVYLRETSNFDVGLSLMNNYEMADNVSYEVWSFPDLPDNLRVGMVNRSAILDGEIYGYLQLISLGIRGLFKKVGIRIKNFLKSGTVCCQVVYLAYQVSGIKEMVVQDYKAEDTADLYDRVTKSGKAIKIMEKKAFSS